MIRKNRGNHSRNQVQENSTDEKEAQDTDSEFPEHSHNSRTESAIKTFEMKFDEKPTETRALLGGSECREDSQKSRTNTCVEITEHGNLKEIKLPLKPKQSQQLQKNDTYCRDVAKKLHKDMELQKIFIKEEGVLYRLLRRTAKEVKQFLGLIGYYRKFGPRFADIS